MHIFKNNKTLPHKGLIKDARSTSILLSLTLYTDYTGNIETWSATNFMKTYYVQRPGNSFTPTLKPAMIIDNMIYLTQTNSIT